MQRFVSWLHRNHLLGGDSIQKLGRAITNATPDFRRAMHGTGRSGFSPAKALVGAMRTEGLDPTDPDQLGRFLDAFNARPQAERDEILGWEDDLDLDLEPGEDDDDEPEPDDGPMPAIELPSVPELATMAEATVTFRQLRTVRDFLETPRRLTQAGNLSLADARTLATHLGLEHRFDPVFHGRQEKTRSVMDIPELDRVFRWAIHARFGEVDRNRAELGPNADLFEESPQEAWLLAMVMLLNGKVLDGDLGWAPFEEPLVDLVEELPAQLYPYGAARIEQLETVAVRLLEEERDLDPPGGPFDLRREIVKALPRRVLEPLTELGVIAIEDGSVSLTPLGRWGLMAWMRAQGIDAPIIGEMTDAPAAEVLAWCNGRTQEEAEAELRAWIAKRPVTAAHEIAEAARSGAPVMEAMFAFELIGPEAETAVRGLLDDDRLAGPALVWLVDQELQDPDDLPTDLLLALMTESLLQVLEDEGPQEMAEHMALQGPIEEQLRMVDALAASDHPRTPELLSAIGKHHPMKPVAKHARTVAFKRLGSQVH
jgi:hypothetical protein